MSTFSKILSKELIKRLPQGIDYEWSRIIEGAYVQVEGKLAHKYVSIFIDCDIDTKSATAILDELGTFLKKNIYFKQSKYRVFLWKDSEFILVSSINVASSRIFHCFKELDSYETTSGDWDNFKTLYTPHKKAGQAILITSLAKIGQLKNSSVNRLKNLLILHPTDKDYKRIQIISGIPCIGCLINSTE